MRSSKTEDKASLSIQLGRQALGVATYAIHKKLITKLDQSFGSSRPDTGKALCSGWLKARDTVLEQMGYDENCDPLEFACDLTVEPDPSTAKSRFVSLDYSGTYFKQEGKSVDRGSDSMDADVSPKTDWILRARLSECLDGRVVRSAGANGVNQVETFPGLSRDVVARQTS